MQNYGLNVPQYSGATSVRSGGRFVYSRKVAEKAIMKSEM